MALKHTLGRALALLTGGLVATNPGTASAKEPQGGGREESAPAPERKPPRCDRPVRTEPFEPGPIDQDVQITFDLNQDTAQEALTESQWLLYGAWEAKKTEKPTPTTWVQEVGRGHWTAGIGEKEQAWAPELRFFAASGQIGGHFTMGGDVGVLVSGWALFEHVDHRRGNLLACRPEFFVEYGPLVARIKRKEIDIETYRTQADALYTTHCIDVWIPLWEGAKDLEGEEIATLVEFLSWWSGGPGWAKVIRTPEDLARHAMVLPPRRAGDPPIGTPTFERTAEGRLRSSGYIEGGGSYGSSVSTFTFDAGPEGFTLERKNLHIQPAPIPY